MVLQRSPSPPPYVEPLHDTNEHYENDQKLSEVAKRDVKVRLAIYLSLIANLFLFGAKLFAYIASGSQAVLASFADSVVDIASQVVVFGCTWKMKRVDPRFPIGITKLETVGAILNACIMTLGSAEVIKSAGGTLFHGIVSKENPVPDMDLLTYLILGSAAGVKAFLFLYCYALRTVSESCLVLAADHRNDVLSNSVVIAAAATATWKPEKLWWVDPAGGILISLYIVWSWLALAKAQIEKIIGLGAPKDFIDAIESLANEHDEDMEVDVIRAYHFGHKYFVELEMIMPESKTVRESHDVGVSLMKKVEALDRVERAFVHVDYEKRFDSEHRIDWSYSTV